MGKATQFLLHGAPDLGLPFTNLYCSLLAHIKELVEVHTAVGELPEDTLLARLDLGLNIRLQKSKHNMSAQHSRASFRFISCVIIGAISF